MPAGCNARSPAARSSSPTTLGRSPSTTKQVTPSTTTASPAPAGGPTATLTVVEADCAGGQAKPTSIVLACGDGAAVAKDLIWASWNPNEAIGSGILSQNTCVPDCAQGTFIDYPAHFVLTEPTATAGRVFFARVTISFVNRSPSGSRVEVVQDCYDTPPTASEPRCPPDLQNASQSSS